MLVEAWEIAQLAAAAAAEKKGYDVLILDISPVSLIADYFVIASASNKIQMAAIADNVEQRLAEQGESILHREGRGEASWILLDYGAVVVHVFREEARQFYALERLWGDAPVHRFKDLTTGANSAIMANVASEYASNDGE
ncbi:MAG TPA: ribosome silencing factor [Firmicutes bacterium]|nr:ribosome silencing factor [Bacillota bacterium]